MTAEVTVRPEAPLLQQHDGGILDVIARAASDPSVDVEKMERLFALKERMDDQERRRQFWAALTAFQAEAPRITKYGKTDKAQFAKLEDIDVAVRPLLAKYGLALSFDTEFVDARVLMTARMSHSAGHFEEKKLPLPVDKGPGRNDIQAMGSTVSYGRRYLTKMWGNIIEVGEDNDGAGPRKVITQAQADQLNDLLAEIGGGEKERFLKWAGVEKLADVPAAKFGRGMEVLLAKRGGK